MKPFWHWAHCTFVVLKTIVQKHSWERSWECSTVLNFRVQNSKVVPKTLKSWPMCGESNMGMKSVGGCVSHIVIASKHKTKNHWILFFARFMEKIIFFPLIFTSAWNGPNLARSLILSGHGNCWRPYQFVELVPKVIPSIRVGIYSLWAVSQFNSVESDHSI
jgi:hypothetical protein